MHKAKTETVEQMWSFYDVRMVLQALIMCKWLCMIVSCSLINYYSLFILSVETHEKRTASLGGASVMQQKKPKSGKKIYIYFFLLKDLQF